MVDIIPPLTQAQIIARIAGATIAPAVVNATGKISTTSTAADSIETAGSMVASANITAVGALLSQTGQVTATGSTATAPTTAGQARFDSVGFYGRRATNGEYFIQLLSADGTSNVGLRRLNADNSLALQVNGTTVAKTAAGLFQVLGTTPATSTAGQTNIGNGTVDFSADVRYRGTKLLGAQGAAVADATGGSTVDTEARAAINALLARLRTHGLIAT